MCIYFNNRFQSFRRQINPIDLQLVVWARRCNFILKPADTVDGSFMCVCFRDYWFVLMPDDQGAILAAADNVLAARTEIQLPYSGFMPSQYLTADPIIDALLMPPAPDRVIVTRWVKQILSWVPLHEFYILWVTRQHGLAWKIFIFIPLPDPNGLITGARRNQVSIWIETDWFNFIFVAFQGTNRLKVIIVLLPHHGGSIEWGWSKT